MLPGVAGGQVWQRFDRIACVGTVRLECSADTLECVRTPSVAEWDIDFPNRIIRYRNADFSEHVVALIDGSAGLSEVAALESGRLLRFHADEEKSAFEASLVGVADGEHFDFTQFSCRGESGGSERPR